jgi:hypothetical protein
MFKYGLSRESVKYYSLSRPLPTGLLGRNTRKWGEIGEEGLDIFPTILSEQIL